MVFKGVRTPFVRDAGGFIVHLNMPGLLDPKSRDHGHGPLAMVVESILDPGRQIAMHEHRDDEIISWVPAGVMRHDDRAQGRLLIDSQHLMVMNAGSGFWHSEETLPGDPRLRMLQILVRPRAVDLVPLIQHGRIEKGQANRWRFLFGPEGSGAPFYVRSEVHFFDIQLDPDATVEFPAMEGFDLYFYVFSGAASVAGLVFEEGEQGLLPGGGPLSLTTAAAPAVIVAFLIDPNAPYTRRGTVGDHRRIPPVWVLRLFARWKRFTRQWRR